MSVPARVAAAQARHGHHRPSVASTWRGRDIAALLAAAAARDDVTDLAMRVYTVVVTVFDRPVSAAQVQAVLPSLTYRGATNILGGLVVLGLLDSEVKIVGYTDSGSRVRRTFYTLAQPSLLEGEMGR